WRNLTNRRWLHRQWNRVSSFVAAAWPGNWNWRALNDVRTYRRVLDPYTLHPVQWALRQWKKNWVSGGFMGVKQEKGSGPAQAGGGARSGHVGGMGNTYLHSDNPDQKRRADGTMEENRIG